MRIFGVDFTSAPCRRKAITVAAGRMKGMTLVIHGIERLETFNAFEALLVRPGPWVGGFDFPFGLPAELCRDLGWPLEWKALVCASRDRPSGRLVQPDEAGRPAGRADVPRRCAAHCQGGRARACAVRRRPAPRCA